MLKNFTLLFASLILNPSALALPTTTTGAIKMQIIEERGALHACSLQVDRWIGNSFDTAYYSANLNPDHSVNNAFNFWNQETDVTAEGDELVPKIIGSNTLRIWNVKNPVDRKIDGGKLKFEYGNQSWNSWSTNSPCVVVPVGSKPPAGATSVSCNFLCDH